MRLVLVKRVAVAQTIAVMTELVTGSFPLFCSNYPFRMFFSEKLRQLRGYEQGVGWPASEGLFLGFASCRNHS